jgi:hypothetical protein
MWQQVPLQHFGRFLRIHFEQVANEPLPRRWVDLIHYLNEKEQRERKSPPKPSSKTKRSS